MSDKVQCTQPCSPDTPCFGHKLQHWRLNGGLNMNFAYGQEQFHDAPSVRERERIAVAEARAAGIEPERR